MREYNLEIGKNYSTLKSRDGEKTTQRKVTTLEKAGDEITETEGILDGKAATQNEQKEQSNQSDNSETSRFAQTQDAQEREKERCQKLLEQYQQEQISFLERLIKQMQINKAKNAKKQKQKSLSYNYQRISGAISQAKTSNQANNALSTAASSLADLQRKSASGQYRSKEIQIALQHARKMVRIARRKLNNIKKEANQQKMDGNQIQYKKQSSQGSAASAHRNQLKRAKMAVQKTEVEKLEKELLQKQKQMQHGNRRSEQLELNEADLEYLKRKIRFLKEQQSGSAMSIDEGVTLELSSGVVASGSSDGSAAGEGAEQAVAEEIISENTAELECVEVSSTSFDVVL